MIFYMCINLGALGSIATTQLEKHVDFWAAYLLPMCMFLVAFVVTILGRRYYIVRAPKGSVIPQALRIFWIGIKNKGKLDSAKPSYQISRGNQAHGFPWSDRFVDEMKRALVGCKVFLYVKFSPYLNYLC